MEGFHGGKLQVDLPPFYDLPPDQYQPIPGRIPISVKQNRPKNGYPRST